jgi:hypothetical protein
MDLERDFFQNEAHDLTVPSRTWSGASESTIVTDDLMYHNCTNSHTPSPPRSLPQPVGSPSPPANSTHSTAVEGTHLKRPVQDNLNFCSSTLHIHRTRTAARPYLLDRPRGRESRTSPAAGKQAATVSEVYKTVV